MAFNEAEGSRLNKDNLKKVGGSNSRVGSSVGASKVGRTSIAQMKKLKKIQNQGFNFNSDANEDQMKYLKHRAYFFEVFGDEQSMQCILFLKIMTQDLQ